MGKKSKKQGKKAKSAAQATPQAENLPDNASIASTSPTQSDQDVRPGIGDVEERIEVSQEDCFRGNSMILSLHSPFFKSLNVFDELRELDATAERAEHCYKGAVPSISEKQSSKGEHDTGFCISSRGNVESGIEANTNVLDAMDHTTQATTPPCSVKELQARYKKLEYELAENLKEMLVFA